MSHGIAQVTFRTPVATNRLGAYSVLDALLARALMIYFDEDWEESIRHMPIEKMQVGNQWLWACGGGYANKEMLPATRQRPSTRRWASNSYLVETFGKDYLSWVRTTFGEHKASTSFPYSVRPEVDTLFFRFSAPDVERVAAILRLLTFIGPGRSVGLGQVDSILVEEVETPENPVIWLFTDTRGRLTRPIPQQDQYQFPGMIHSVGRVRTPYWTREDRIPVYEPVGGIA